MAGYFMPLSALRVVELGTGSALAYGGKIFSDLGADVLKVEPMGGDPGRAEPPLVDVGGGPRESAYFAWLNTNKRSRIAGPEDEESIAALLADTDLLLDARGPDAVSRGVLAHDRLRVEKPGLVIVALSWFGEDGPYRDFVATDTTCRALAGLINLIGPREKPVAINDHQADIVAGISSFIAAMAGLLAGGPGRRFSLSIHEANVVLSDSHTVHGPNGPRGRFGVNRFSSTFPMGIYPCLKGWLGLGLSTPQQWRDFCGLFGVPELAADPRFFLGVDRAVHADEIEAHFAPKLLARTSEEWFSEGLRRRLPFAIVPDMATLLAQEVPRAAGAFVPVRIGDATFEAPALPLRLTRTPPRAGGIAPRAGEFSSVPPRARRLFWDAVDPALPLAGVKIVDFTMGWAGPLVARHVADLGAEVIKIEACRHYDWWRGQDHRPEAYPTRIYEKRATFLELNRNKQGITLDLTTAEGVALAKRLVARADAVVENFSREVMPKLGLDYAALSEKNPELVMVSMAAFPRGPWESGRAYGFTLEQAAGVPSVAGPPEGPPMLSHYAYGDPIGGLNGTAALLAGLWHKRLTGQGQHIDLSQVACMIPMIAPWLIAQSATGKTPSRMGNRHPHYVPQNIFLSSGPDLFLAISVTTDAMWQALCGVIGRADLAREPALATAEGRRAHEEKIETAIEAWTSTRDADAAMNALQAACVAAGVARSPYDLASDPHLAARGFWQLTERKFVAPHVQSSLPFRESGKVYPVRHPAPTMGEFNDAVLGGILGLSPAEMARLTVAEIIGTEALAPHRGG
jgi:crotonobetainyl-CoA:carnitine CoA-transferase CaiB-like acyl-CoA transferase